MEIRLPALAENVSSGVVVSILVSEGDRVEQDQEILELETDKAMAAVPAPEAGRISKIHVKEGDEVSAGQVIFTLSPDHDGEKPKEAEGRKEKEPKEKQRKAKAVEKQEEESREGKAVAAEEPDYEDDEERPIAEGEEAEGAHDEAAKAGFGPPASPSVRKLARQLGINLSRVRGSQRGGRIVPDDLRIYIERLQKRAQGLEPEKKSIQLPDFAKWGYIRKEPMSRLRKTIGEAMSASWSTVPHVTQFGEADVTEIIASIKRYSPQYERKGARLTFTGIVLKALVPVLEKYLIFNSSLDVEAGEMVFKKYFHFGIAVDTEQGLIVPVLRDVDQKDLLTLSKELEELAEKTRQRKVSLEELQGATFTISNQGGIGGSHFTPIVHTPEVAILGLGRASLKPVAVDKKIEARMIVPLSLSYDHRAIDGADAARFIRDLIASLEGFSEDGLKLPDGKEDARQPAKGKQEKQAKQKSGKNTSSNTRKSKR